MNLVYKLAAGIGALTTFAYLLLIQHFPSGLTPGEVIFFAFIALAFSFIYFVILIYGAFASLWILHLIAGFRKLLRFNKRTLISELFSDHAAPNNFPWLNNQQFLENLRQTWRGLRFSATRRSIEHPSLAPSFAQGWLYGITSLALFSIFAITAYEAQSTQLTEFLFACVFAGFIVLIFLSPGNSTKQSKQNTLTRIIGISIVPLAILLIYAGPTALLNIVFEGLGIRSPGVSIELPESESGAIERIQDLVGRPLLDCRKPQPGRLLIHNADILWTGIGEQTLVQFGSGKKPERGFFSPRESASPLGIVKLDTKSIRIIKANPPIDPCFDLPSDLLFDTGRYSLTPQAKKRIEELANSIKKNGQPKQIIVRGHSDPRRIFIANGRKMDNQKLSEYRAEAIARLLKKKFRRSKGRC